MITVIAAASLQRRELALMAGDACSDHLALLEAVKQYQAVRRNGGELVACRGGGNVATS